MNDSTILAELDLQGNEQDAVILKEADAQTKLLNHLKVSVRAVVSQGVSSGAAVDIQSHNAHKITMIIRIILKHGLKDRKNGSIVTLWNFIYGNVPRLEERWRFWYEDILHQKPNLPHEPLFTFWLQRALSEHLVHHHLGVILTPDLIQSWYEEWALLQTEENAIIFLTLLNSLESISFDISTVEDVPESNVNDDLVVRRVKSRKIVKRKTVKFNDDSNQEVTQVEEASNEPSAEQIDAMRRLEEERRRMQYESKIAAEEAAEALAIAERLRKEAAEREAEVERQKELLAAEQERQERQLQEQKEQMEREAQALAAEKLRLEEAARQAEMNAKLLEDERAREEQRRRQEEHEAAQRRQKEMEATEAAARQAALIEEQMRQERLAEQERQRLQFEEMKKRIEEEQLQQIRHAEEQERLRHLAEDQQRQKEAAEALEIEKQREAAQHETPRREAEASSIEPPVIDSTAIEIAIAEEMTRHRTDTLQDVTKDGDTATDEKSDAPSIEDIMAEVRRAAEAAEMAAAEFERKYSTHSNPNLAGTTRQQEEAVESGESKSDSNSSSEALQPTPDCQTQHSEMPTSEPPHEDVQMEKNEDVAERLMNPEPTPIVSPAAAVALKDLDPDARRKAIEEKLRRLREIDGIAEDASAESKQESSSVPAAAAGSAANAEDASDVQAKAESGEAPVERWKQLEEDLRRMRAEQESLQIEAFEAERQRRLAQTEAEALRLVEEARRKRVEKEEEELARLAEEEEAAREQQRLALEAELTIARGAPIQSNITEREMLERQREEMEAEKTRLRLQKEIYDAMDSPKRVHSGSSSSSSTPSPRVSVRRSGVMSPTLSRPQTPSPPPSVSSTATVDDFDSDVGVLLTPDGHGPELQPDDDEFQPRDPKRKALSFNKPYSFETSVMKPNVTTQSGPAPTAVASATPVSASKPVADSGFSQHKNPSGLSTSYVVSGRTPNESDEPLGSFVDPSRFDRSAGEKPKQAQKLIDVAKRNQTQQQLAAGRGADPNPDDASPKSKQNFTLEDFLSGELDGLEEDTSMSPIKSPRIQTVVEEAEPAFTGKWAPPKKRVYFNIQIKSTTEAQGNLCAGCGKEFQSGIFGKNCRYCDYSGKYFCTTCHSKQVSIIPARVVRAWDFKGYQVSNFYRAFLEQMFMEPLYDIDAISPSLYQIVPKLKQIKVVRIMLTYMHDFTASCRKRQQLITVAEKLTRSRPHLFNGTSYSLNDLIEVQKDKLMDPLIQLCKIWMHHILYCEICRGKGSFCEFCKSSEVIYPFHLRYTVVCKECRAVSHRKCFKKGECPRCRRLQARKSEVSSSSM